MLLTKPRIVVLGGGLGGTIAAFDIDEKMQNSATITLVSDAEKFAFTPSNPWVAVGWRKADAIKVDLSSATRRRGIEFVAQGAVKIVPETNHLRLADGSTLEYDYLVIATGPDLAYDAIEGFGPEGFTHSICQTSHAVTTADAFENLCADPAPIVVGAVQGASCFGPAYEFAMILDTELRRRKLRDRVPMTFVTPEPYIGHFGLDGVGDTKSMLESEMRDRHIKWITNAQVDRVEDGLLHVTQLHRASAAKVHEVPFGFAMLLPAFRGVDALQGVEGLTNPKGFVLVDEHQRNPTFTNVFALGVCIAIPPVGDTLVPLGVPKTGFMIESMASAIAENIRAEVMGYEATSTASWNAICLADFGDGGVAFIAQPQIPPRNVDWSSRGRWVHLAKIAFEKFFLRKIRKGHAEPAYERLALKMLGVTKLKKPA